MTAVRSGRRVQLPAPPERLGDELYVPLEPLTEAAGFRFRRVPGDPDLLTFSFPQATLQGVRTNADGERVRFVFDLSSAVPFLVDRDGRRLVLTLPASPASSLVGEYLTDDTACPAATLDLTRPTQVRAALRAGPHYPFELFTLSAPARIVVDVKKRYETVTTRPVVPGIEWLHVALGTGAGPIIANVARVDLTRPAYAVRPVMAGTTILVRDTPSRIARRVGALVAVNGGFFARDQGAPLGLVVIDRELVRTPVFSRTSLGITRDGKAHVGRVSSRGYLRLENDFRLPVTKLNGARTAPAGLYLYTRWWDTVVPVAPTEYCLQVVDGTVVRGTSGAPVTIPAAGYLAVGRGYMATALLQIPVGARLEVHFDTQTVWASMLHALGGGPRLVEHGIVHVSSEGENFKRDVAAGRAPRTAVGVTRDQHLLLATVDGRQPDYSVGMTLTELARLLTKLGAWEAMNLDGGGSTSFVVGGRCRNRPSGGAERRVSNILAVVPRE